MTNDDHRTRPAAGRGARRRRTAAALSVVVGLAGIAVPGAASAARPPGRESAADLQRSLDALVRDDHFPAALAGVRAPNGSIRNHRAGVADIRHSRQPPMDGRVRIGSNTKTFVAVVVLQLVAEGKVDLDASVDTYLPGLLRGDGIDGRHITVRQLLQHTSGLPDYSEFLGEDISGVLDAYVDPRELLDVALAQGAVTPSADAKSKYHYSNTNYLVAGLLIQKVTRRPLGEEITTRIIDPLQLRHTSFPAPGEQRIRGAHPHGYLLDESGKPVLDVTDLDPSAAWAAGAMVSTPGDLNRFLAAVLAGRVLPPAQLAQMLTTVQAPDGTHHGLGLSRRSLPCGGYAWSHGGAIAGFQSRMAVTDDGRAASVAVTALSPDATARAHVGEAIDTALCS